MSLNQWNGGFVATIRVTAGASPINGWTVTMTLPSGATITNAWNVNRSGNTGAVQFTNVAFNGSIGAGQFTEWGFQATGNGAGMTPTCTAGMAARPGAEVSSLRAGPARLRGRSPCGRARSRCRSGR